MSRNPSESSGNRFILLKPHAEIIEDSIESEIFKIKTKNYNPSKSPSELIDEEVMADDFRNAHLFAA
jgi:hypothetical protein